MRFKGKAIIVTGASRGIGYAIAERIVAEGGRVMITGRKQSPLAEAAERLGGPKVCLFVAGAADDPEHQDTTVRTAIEHFGALDVLINNVGINPAYGNLLEIEHSAMRKMVDVNVIAALDWIRKSLEEGLGESNGAVVNVASVAGVRPADGIGFYGATKAAVLYLTQQLAKELSPSVRVNAVAPAVVRTAFATPLFEGKEEEVSAHYPLRRLGEPSDVAGAVAFLASDDASWVTGQVLTLDGGLTLGGGI